MSDYVIASAKNPLIKQLRKLMTSTKERRVEDLTIAEGIHLVESMQSTDLILQQVVVAESAIANQEISNLLKQLAQGELQTVKDSLFESISDIHAAVGVLGVFTPKSLTHNGRLENDAVVFDRLQDPGNLGNILRTAVATGVREAYLSSGSTSAWSPKALRAGMGAQFRLKIYENVDVLDLLSRAEVKVAITSLNGTNSIYQTDLSKPVAWVFGNEGQGVSQEIEDLTTEQLIIPQVEYSVESLNVAAAAAVCLYEQYRQRRLAKTAIL